MCVVGWFFSTYFVVDFAVSILFLFSTISFKFGYYILSGIGFEAPYFALSLALPTVDPSPHRAKHTCTPNIDVKMQVCVWVCICYWYRLNFVVELWKRAQCHPFTLHKKENPSKRWVGNSQIECKHKLSADNLVVPFVALKRMSLITANIDIASNLLTHKWTFFPFVANSTLEQLLRLQALHEPFCSSLDIQQTTKTFNHFAKQSRTNVDVDLVWIF